MNYYYSGLIFLGLILFCTQNVQSDDIFEEYEIEGGEDERIIGGKIATTNYPFMVSMQSIEFDSNGKVKSRKHHCGGSILNEKWILTAAHCLNPAAPFYILAGTRNFNGVKTYAEEPQTIKVKQQHWPNDYWSDYFENDVALLQLEKPLKLNQYVQPIKLLKSTDKLKTNNVILIGWGYENSTGSFQLSNQLRELKIQLRKRRDCYTTNNFQTGNKELCAGSYGKTSCTMDSGSPMFQKTELGYVQLGVTSFTMAMRGTPCMGDTVYMDVRAYVDTFINPTMRGNK